MIPTKAILKCVCILFICSIFVGCAARKEHSLFNAPSDVVTDTIKQVYVVNDQGISDAYYKIKVNDQLAIRNVQNKEFGASTSSASNPSGSQNVVAGSINSTLSYLVDIDGKVNLPAIGKVEVLGLSRRDAAIKIQDLYAKQLLRDPIIELSVVNLKVTLLGEFSRQGNFLLERENTTLIDIIGEAGGINKTADPKTLKIIRGERSHPEIIYVNLNDINSLASKKLILQNNDIIVLQQTKSSALSEKLTSVNNIVQPLLVVVNLAVLIFTLTR
ncbi:polysaccharide biosynthesis/export family protein [Pedobacter sp. ISL-68]|uniref:polysaccharide biosynthesis/export family protein n=1 Tax=unclassified Pedobacter TaxID=2628915 RepID=UPI001BE905D1|nr:MULTISPECIES: polysaccharide biosynthesis/export family protein [unclassified Pedobacter]MBT2562821.1 polysaccharide biosynthesis/export family protein [Pedobacter sp. ISL-64]MBT2593334.1 polysaccharide biosynthesis/export family protein [Pedobacter sp. ISL-68]